MPFVTSCWIWHIQSLMSSFLILPNIYIVETFSSPFSFLYFALFIRLPNYLCCDCLSCKMEIRYHFQNQMAFYVSLNWNLKTQLKLLQISFHIFQFARSTFLFVFLSVLSRAQVKELHSWFYHLHTFDQPQDAWFSSSMINSTFEALHFRMTAINYFL